MLLMNTLSFFLALQFDWRGIDFFLQFCCAGCKTGEELGLRG